MVYKFFRVIKKMITFNKFKRTLKILFHQIIVFLPLCLNNLIDIIRGGRSQIGTLKTKLIALFCGIITKSIRLFVEKWSNLEK